MNKNDISIDIITVIPKNQFNYSYSINGGSKHSIKKYDIFTYLKQFINKNQFRYLLDLISRFRAFIIVTKEKRIIELTKNSDDFDYYSNRIKKNINENIESKIKSKNQEESVPNDNLLEKNIEKYYKKI